MIHYFNPGHETAVLNASPYYMPPAIQLKMRKDLAFLSSWYAFPQDYIFTEDELNPEFTDSTNRLENIPTAITEKDFIHKKEILSNQKVCLWGISPGSIHTFEAINKQHNLNLTIPEWHPEYFHLCSRSTAKDCLEYITEKINRKNRPEDHLAASGPDCIDPSIIPSFYSDIGSIEEIVTQSDSELLAKAPYSSSGRGLLWLAPGNLSQSSKQILSGMLKKQKQVSIEKSLNKTIDFALEFFSDGSGNISFRGYSLFQTDGKGNYTGNILSSQKNIEQKIHASISPELLTEVKRHLIDFIRMKFSSVYEGCIGVDMLIYQKNNLFRLHPCVEINMRHNMGFLSVELYKKHIDNCSEGFFRIDFNAQPGKALEQHKKMMQAHPLIFRNNKIKSGYLALCPVSEKTNYHAYVVIDQLLD